MTILKKCLPLTLIAASLTLTACVTPGMAVNTMEKMTNSVDKMASGVSEESCSTSDWDATGYEHATKDKNLRLADQYEENCGKYGKTFDRVSYEAGYVRGIEDHCTAELGTKRGNSLIDYKGPCLAVPDYAYAYKKASSSAGGFEVLTGNDLITEMEGGDPYEERAVETPAGKPMGSSEKRRELVREANKLAKSLNGDARKADSKTNGSKNREIYKTSFDAQFAKWLQANRDAQVYIKSHTGLKPLATYELTKVKPYRGFDKSKFR